MKVSPANPQFIVAATDNGIFMSTNRGGIWQPKNTGLPPGAFNVHQVAFDLNDLAGNTAYIATGTSVYKGVYSAGQWTWTPSTTGTSLLNVSSVAAHSGILYAVSTSWNGVARYSGGSWQIVRTTLGFLGYSAAVSPSYPLNVFTSGSLNGRGVIDRSTDDGTTWAESEKVSASNTQFSKVVPDHKAGSESVFGGLAGSGVGQNNFRVSFNLGSSWTTSSVTGFAGDPVTDIAVDASTATTSLYAGLGSPKGVFRSYDVGFSFSFAALNTWVINSIALNSSTYQLGNTVYVGGVSNLWKTTDRFATSPSMLTIPFTGARQILMHPSYPNYADHIWVITANGQKIYKTANGGVTWDEINTAGLPKSVNDLRNDPTSNALVYVGTAGGVYKLDPAPEAPTGVTGSDDGNGHPRIDWDSNIEADLHSTMPYEVYKYTYSCIIVNGVMQCAPPGPAALQATTTQTFYVDESETLGDPCPPPCEEFNRAGYYVKAVDEGLNRSEASAIVEFDLYFIPGGGGGEGKIVVAQDPTPKLFSLSANYPNPFNPTTRIEYTLPEDVHVSLKVFDMLGREVTTLANGFQEAGYRTARFDAGDLSSGLYLVRLIATHASGSVKFMRTHKLVLMK
jgi:photosystem II stability/assembly factor-like uncharacterized protein